MSTLLLALFLVFPLCMVWAAVTDVMGYRITNMCNLVLVAGFAPFAAVTLLAGPQLSLEWPQLLFDWSDLGWHVAAALAMLVAGFLLFLPGILGAGDAKLIAATALWIGPGGLSTYVLAFATIGGAIALLIVVWRRLPLPDALAQSARIAHAHDRKTPIPYGLALAPGGLAALSASPWAPLLSF